MSFERDMYNNIIYKNSKIKYIGIIAIEVCLSIVALMAIKSFYLEDQDMTIILLLGILQVINIIKYILVRCVYKNELLNLNNDLINTFVFSKAAKVKILKYKLLQMIIMLSYEFPVTLLLLVFFNLSREGSYISIINILFGIIIFYTFALIDMTVINKYKKGYFDGILNTVVLIGIINLFFNPSYLSFGILLIVIFTLTISNFILILRSCEND